MISEFYFLNVDDDDNRKSSGVVGRCRRVVRSQREREGAPGGRWEEWSLRGHRGFVGQNFEKVA